MIDRVLSDSVEGIKDYIQTSFYDDSWGPKPIIAIVVVEGAIFSGESQKGSIFSQKTVTSL